MRRTLCRLALHTRLTRDPFVDVAQEGFELLNNPALNKGSAFSLEERHIFGMRGLLPARVNTLEEQVDRAYKQFKMYPTDLLKNTFCESLKQQNEVLYFSLLKKHLKEMISIIYTPTEGDAITLFSQLFRRPSGCFLDIDHPEDIEKALAHYGNAEDIDYIVVTDSEGILGIGDQGVGGIGIAISKLTLMTLCGGVHPDRVIPVVLDTGTNNEALLKGPLYMGNRRVRVRGTQYDEFVDKFVQTVKTNFPKAVLHFEDFGTNNAHRLLSRYQNELPCFNDDIQGTGAVTLSAIKSALHSTNRHLYDARIVIFGAGSAGMGIANQLVDNMVAQGREISKARENIYMVDRVGLLTSDITDQLNSSQRPFVKDAATIKHFDTKSLFEIVKNIKPHILIGCSTVPGAFTKEIVQEMNKHVDRPIILPLSNPTRLHEAKPADLIEWTNGKVLVATGSPFPPVNGRRISENNNCLVFPGIGLGAVLSRASRISKGMIAAAVDELARLSPVMRDADGPLLPDIEDVSYISTCLATSVVLRAKMEGIATIEKEVSPINGELIEISDDWDECFTWVESQMWKPEYRRYRRLHSMKRH